MTKLEKQVNRIKKAVTKGAKLLDTFKPNWAEKINTAELRMDSDIKCILGQLSKGKCMKIINSMELDDDEKNLVSHGFIAKEHSENPILAEAWRTLIKERKS